MLGKDHQIVSVALVAGGLTLVQPEPTLKNLTSDAVMLGSTLVGALLPDIDSSKSIINRYLPLKLSYFFHHRGLTHSLLGLIIFGGLLYWLFHGLMPTILPLYLGLVIGYALHLVEDGFSQAGVRWLAPFSPYDRWSYMNYNIYLCRPVRFKKRHGKKIPVRHWWGRGYQVGGEFEKVITGISELGLIVAVVLLVTRWLWYNCR